ncbi:MAG: NAD(P)H-dependent oxidoreductase [Candidatus Thermoplasmatota archaeon]
MKVLGISGSQRIGGNTTILLEEALKAIHGRVETELVALADFGAPGHRADGKLDEVVEKMRQADAFLLATPSYFGMPPGRMVALLDATWEDQRKGAFAAKAGAALAVESEWGGELAAQCLGHYFTAHRMLYLGYAVGRGLKEREILYDIKAIREARLLANRLADHLESKRR